MLEREHLNTQGTLAREHVIIIIIIIIITFILLKKK